MTREEYERITQGAEINKIIHEMNDDGRENGLGITVLDSPYDTIRDILQRLQEAGEKADHFREPAKSRVKHTFVYYHVRLDTFTRDGFFSTARCGYKTALSRAKARLRHGDELPRGKLIKLERGAVEDIPGTVHVAFASESYPRWTVDFFFVNLEGER